MLHWLPVPKRIQFKIAISALTVSVSTVLPTLTTSASQSLASLAGHIFVQLNAMTCLSLRQEHSLVDGVSMLQPQPSGTSFHHIFAHHPSVVDSLGLGWKPISSHRPTDTSENFCWKAYSFTFLHYIQEVADCCILLTTWSCWWRFVKSERCFTDTSFSKWIFKGYWNLTVVRCSHQP